MRARLGLLAMFAIAAACGGGSDNPAGPDVSHVGSYTLQSVDGHSLPVVLFEGENNKLEVVAATLTLTASNAVKHDVTFRVTIEGVVQPLAPVSCPGTYQRNGSTISLTMTDTDDCGGGTFSANFTSGNTIDIEGSIYRK